MASIRDVPNTKWRDELMPAHFNGALFHVESGSIESGRRIVVHEFPKKDLPYSEDMGRKARNFSVRGYCIAYPHDTSIPLYVRDYRNPRNVLIAQLEAEGAGLLQLPTFPPLMVVCQSYRVGEEQRFGGYCTFDMQFTEWGLPPGKAPTDTAQALLNASRALAANIESTLNRSIKAQIDKAHGVNPTGVTRPKPVRMSEGGSPAGSPSQA